MTQQEIFNWIYEEAQNLNLNDEDEAENGLRRIRDRALEGATIGAAKVCPVFLSITGEG